MQTTQLEVVRVPKPLPERLENELALLRNELAELYNSYSLAAAPYIKRMAYIESLRSHKTYVVATQEPNHGS